MRKMRGGSLETTTGTLNTILLLVLIAVLGFIGYQIYKMNTSQVTFAGVSAPAPAPAPTFLSVQTAGGQDDRYTQAPKPLRFWRAPPDTSVWNPTTLPSIATQGLPESFQAIGLLKYPGGDLKPLYGRRLAGSNDRWNYYTRTDTYNPVPLPLSQGRRDCMDDSSGCTEVFDGDTLKSLNGEVVSVKLYRMNGPTYIPSI
jgi:hypothetical protein